MLGVLIHSPEFYESLGYETFGRVESIPDGNARLFMKKRLRPR